MDHDDFDDNGPWVSTNVACERMAITPPDVLRLIDAGRLPAYKFGSVIRLRRSDVERLAGAL